MAEDLTNFENFINGLDFQDFDENAGVPIEGEPEGVTAHTVTEYELNEELAEQILMRSGELAKQLLKDRDPSGYWEENFEKIFLKMRVGVGHELLKHLMKRPYGGKLRMSEWADVVAISLSLAWLVEAMMFSRDDDDDDGNVFVDNLP